MDEPKTVTTAAHEPARSIDVMFTRDAETTDPGRQFIDPETAVG